MIEREKSERAMSAICAGIIWAKNFAYEKRPHKEIGDFLDHLEGMIQLVMQKEDETAMFEMALKEMHERFGCGYMQYNYDNPQ